MRYIIFIISFISLISCKSEINNKLKLTNYIGNLEIEKDRYLPFNFSVINDSVLVTATYDFFRYGSIYPIFSSSTSTFDDLSSTGNLKDIKNTLLRDELVKHYAQHKQVAEWIKIGTEWALPNDAPFTYNNSVMRFEPVSAFLFGKQNLSE